MATLSQFNPGAKSKVVLNSHPVTENISISNSDKDRKPIASSFNDFGQIEKPENSGSRGKQGLKLAVNSEDTGYSNLPSFTNIKAAGKFFQPLENQEMDPTFLEVPAFDEAAKRAKIKAGLLSLKKNQKSLYPLKHKPDCDWVEEKIHKILLEGLTELARQRPSNPIKFLGLFLLENENKHFVDKSEPLSRIQSPKIIESYINSQIPKSKFENPSATSLDELVDRK